MNSTRAVVFAALASNVAAANICGQNQPDLCGNQSAAISHPYASYQNYAGATTLSECRSTCLAESQCESYQFYYSPEGGLSPSSLNCFLFSVPVSEYTTSCADRGTDSAILGLEYFYDKGCSAVPMKTAGQVPATCVDSYCYPTGNLRVQAYPDLMESYFNITYATCIDHCSQTSECKAVWYQYAPPNAAMGFNGQTSGVSNKYQCILLSRPVIEMLDQNAGGFVTMNDINCPSDGIRYGYAARAPICGNGTIPHSFVYGT